MFRIRALTTFTTITGVIAEGDFGGYIEKEENLSHNGNAWIGGDAWVFGNTKVYDNAKVGGNALVFGNAKVGGDAWVFDNARAYDNAKVDGNTKVGGNAWVHDSAWISGNAKIGSNAEVYGNAKVSGDAEVYGNAEIGSNANIESNNDYIIVKGFGHRNRSTTFFKTKNNEVHVKCGRFRGNLTEFEKEMRKAHQNTKYAKEYLAIVQAVKIHFEIND